MRIFEMQTHTSVRLTPENRAELSRELGMLAFHNLLTAGGVLAELRAQLEADDRGTIERDSALTNHGAF